MKVVFLSYAFPPQIAPRATQVARLAQYSSLSIRVLCAGMPGTEPALRTGVEIVRFPDTSSRWWRRAKRLLLLPDSERPWADRLAKTILTNDLVEPNDVLATFGQPMSDHLAGLKIKRRLGVPWIAHFSDPWSDNPYLSQNPVSRLRLRHMESQVFAAADRLLFTSDETVELVMRKHPAVWHGKASVLPHAYDPAFDRDVAPRRGRAGPFVLRHLGNFYGPRNPLMLIRALVLLRKTQPSVLDNVKIELVGRWVDNERWSPADSGLPDSLLTFCKPVAYEESLRQMCSADGLLIIDAPFQHNVFFPSKLVEYLWARRPILALTPPGTSANIVAASGGVLASPETPETIAAGLVNIIHRLRAGTAGAPSEDIVTQYDARRVAEAFDRVVIDLVSTSKIEITRDRHVA